MKFVKCALIKLNAFIICEMLPPWIKALAIILPQNPICNTSVEGVGGWCVGKLYSLQADGKRDSLWFLWLVFTCCTIYSVHRLMSNEQC